MFSLDSNNSDSVICLATSSNSTKAGDILNLNG